MPKPFTHIIITTGENAILYRASDGMVLGGRMGTVVQYGQNPLQVDQRNFLDDTFAKMFLRRLADADEAASMSASDTASIDERSGDKRIISPADAVGAGLRH